MFAIDFGAHWPQKGHKMLLETGPTGQTGVMKLQEVSGLIFPPPPGMPTRYLKFQRFWAGVQIPKVYPNTDIKS